MSKKRVKATDQAALRESQSARLGWINQQWAEHPASGLTPQRLRTILDDAERGNMQAQSDLFTDMEERDGHLFSEMSKRKRVLLDVDWQITPPKKASAQEKKQAEEVAEWIDEINDFEDVMLNGFDAVGHGYSAQEITWERVEKLWLPQSFEHQLPRDFQVPSLMSGLPRDEIRLRNGMLDGEELWPFGWFVHKQKSKSGLLVRGGLHRVLSWPYLFKHYSVRDLMEFLDIYGLPLRLGKYPAGASSDEKSTLLRAVTQIGHSAAGIVPQGMDITFEEAAKGTSDPFEVVIKWCELTQSKAILGGTLTTQADGKTSTHALGKVHDGVRKELAKSDARQFASSMSSNLIASLMQLNRPDVDPRRYPKFEFDLTEPEDITVYSEAMPKLVGTGMKKIPVSWLHKKLGIPVAQGGEEVLQVEDLLPADAPPKPVALAANSRQIRSVGLRLSALSQLLPEPPAPDQAALDDAIAGLLAGDLNDDGHALLNPIMNEIAGVKTIAEAQAVLDRVVPDQPPKLLQARLTQLLFAADVWGRINVQAELTDA